jgi:uncharacterized protein YcgI (DUF1989 family)
MKMHTVALRAPFAARLFGGQGRAFPLSKNQQLTVVNTEGTQVVDMWAILPASHDEYMSMAHTHVHTSRLVPRVGDALWSNHRRELFRVVEDTSPGVHDTLLAACDVDRYRLLGYRGYHRNCCDNFRQALATLGIPRASVPDPFNLFQNTPWQADGELGAEPGAARPGERITFEALDDLVVVLSACPMDLNPINGDRVRDVEVRVRDVVPSAQTGHPDGSKPELAVSV